MKVVPFTPKNEKKSQEPWYDFDIPEERFCIIDEATGEVLDDAQGYGYKSVKKAYAAWAYKHRDASKDAELLTKTKIIKEWMRENHKFMDWLDQAAFEIAKGSWGPDDRFDAAFVKTQLEEEGYADLPFTAAELFKVMQKGALCPEPRKKKKRKNQKPYEPGKSRNAILGKIEAFCREREIVDYQSFLERAREEDEELAAWAEKPGKGQSSRYHKIYGRIAGVKRELEKERGTGDAAVSGQGAHGEI